MTRTDALLFAARSMLEQFRPMLDSTGDIKSVRLEMSISPDGKVRAAQLLPSFQANAQANNPIEIGKFDFENNLLRVEKQEGLL